MNPTSWSPSTRRLVVILLLAGGILLLIFAAPVVKALLAAGLIAYLLDGVVRATMGRFNMKHRRAVILVYAIFLILLISIPTLLGSLAVDQLSLLSGELTDALAALQQRLLEPIHLLGVTINPQTAVSQIERLGNETLSLMTGNGVLLLADITSSLYWGLLILISAYYMLQDGERIKDWLLTITPSAYQPEIRYLMGELNKLWRLALRIQILIFLILAALILVGTLLIIWLFQSGLIDFSLLLLIVLLVLLFVAVQQVDNLWLRPMWMGHSLKIHPGIIFVGLMGALAVGGVLGLILVVPLIGSAKVLGEYISAKLLDQPYPPEDSAATA